MTDKERFEKWWKRRPEIQQKGWLNFEKKLMCERGFFAALRIERRRVKKLAKKIEPLHRLGWEDEN